MNALIDIWMERYNAEVQLPHWKAQKSNKEKQINI